MLDPTLHNLTHLVSRVLTGGEGYWSSCQFRDLVSSTVISSQSTPDILVITCRHAFSVHISHTPTGEHDSRLMVSCISFESVEFDSCGFDSLWVSTVLSFESFEFDIFEFDRFEFDRFESCEFRQFWVSKVFDSLLIVYLFSLFLWGIYAGLSCVMLGVMGFLILQHHSCESLQGNNCSSLPLLFCVHQHHEPSQ